MTDLLEGLSAELRKAVKTLEEIDNEYFEMVHKKQNASFEEYDELEKVSNIKLKELLLPAVLVVQEMRKFRRDVIIDFLNKIKKTCGFNICEEHNRARFYCPDYIKLLDEYEITYTKEKG